MLFRSVNACEKQHQENHHGRYKILCHRFLPFVVSVYGLNYTGPAEKVKRKKQIFCAFLQIFADIFADGAMVWAEKGALESLAECTVRRCTAVVQWWYGPGGGCV